MNTGIESWNIDLMSIGPMYPFVGSEVWLTIIGVATWLIWHVMQARAEARELADELAECSKPEALAQSLDRELS